MKDNTFIKNKFLISFFKHYFRYSLRRNFSYIHVKGLTSVLSAVEKSAKDNRPLIYCVNHSSWWDVPVIIYLTYDLLRSDSYCLMEKKQFDIHPYFRGIGAVPIIREDARNAAMVLKKCSDHLNGTGRSLWIFPQGEIIPNAKRPVHFFSGIAHLLEQLRDPILVCTFLDFKFTGNQFPEIYVDMFHIDYEINLARDARASFTKNLSGIYEQQADEFEILFANGKLDDYEVCLAGKKSINDRSFTKFA